MDCKEVQGASCGNGILYRCQVCFIDRCGQSVRRRPPLCWFMVALSNVLIRAINATNCLILMYDAKWSSYPQSLLVKSWPSFCCLNMKEPSFDKKNYKSFTVVFAFKWTAIGPGFVLVRSRVLLFMLLTSVLHEIGTSCSCADDLVWAQAVSQLRRGLSKVQGVMEWKIFSQFGSDISDHRSMCT